jgi:hypothetical protein
MAENKKSFILYCDQKGVWDKLDDAQAGRLIKHVIAYVNDENPEAPDFITELAFEPIKASLKRDLKKWEKQQTQRSEAGKRSAEVRKRNAKLVKRDSTTVNERSVSSTVNGNVSVNGSVSDNVNVSTDVDIPAYDEFKEYALDKCSELNFNVPENSINAKYQSWKANGWRNGNGKKIKNWKTTILNTLPYLQQKETIEKIETKEEREAREMMEEIKRQAIHESLYGNNQIGNV